MSAAGYDARQQSASAGTCNLSDTSWPTAVTLPDGTVLTGSAPLGVSATPVTTIVFDALGVTNLASNQTLTVGGFTIVIHAGSGYVETP